MLGLCYTNTPKGKGSPSPTVCRGNPCNVGSGNKFQTEPVYANAPATLRFALVYNSQPGSSYFDIGPFGTRWVSRYLTVVRDSGQGLVGADLPNGKELEFHTPASGNLYTADGDVSDRLESITDANGVIQGWRLTTSNGDEVFTYDANGNLSTISNRALVTESMIYSTSTTPSSIAPTEGLLIGVSDKFGRQINLVYDSNRHIVQMTDPAGGTYSFQYDGSTGPSGGNNLTKITFPDGSFRTTSTMRQPKSMAVAPAPTRPRGSSIA